MILDAIFDSVVDGLTVIFALYIIGVSVGRIAMMSWATHRKSWQIIYLLMCLSSAGYLARFAENGSHGQIAPFCIYLATALWFIESRKRWRVRAPDYMSTACPHLDPNIDPPDDCPLNKEPPT